MNTILITGGLGYIGSYIAVKLLNAGNKVIIVDNGSNTDRVLAMGSIIKTAGVSMPSRLFIKDVNCNTLHDINKVFVEHRIDTVIHLAGYKSVYESFKKEDKYLYNNINTTKNILECMNIHHVRNLIFSSSCTVYGDGYRGKVFIENDAYRANSPYATTKVRCEKMITSNSNISSIIFRYFNPVGYHESGFLYEYPHKKSTHNNLFYEITQVLLGKKPKLVIYGDCFETYDGTAERNYLDINDLWEAHRIGLTRFGDAGVHQYYNLGNKSYTVQQVIDIFYDKGLFFEYEIRSAQKGAFSSTDASIVKAGNILGWEPTVDLHQTVDNLKQLLKEQTWVRQQ